MKIHDLDHRTEHGRSKASASVTWEDCERPPQRIYVETAARFADGLSCNPNAFLLAAFVPAMCRGERRVLVEGKICPQLRNGLITAMQQLQQWYGEREHRLVAIEATKGFEAPQPHGTTRTASFLSGGVDALTTLRTNRLDFPVTHPGAIQDCFLVHGIDLGGYEALDKRKANFDLAVASLAGLAEQEKAILIPVSINLRSLDESDSTFAMKSHGAVLAAIAHAFSRRISTALIASTSHILELVPWGSHPLLDLNYSSSDVSIRHDGARLTRLEKVRILCDWEIALRHLRSCYNPFRPNNVLNCGKCEKCLRTMTELLVCGKLAQCSTFPFDNITPEVLQTLEAVPSALNSPFDFEKFPPRQIVFVNADHWRGLIGPLSSMGRHDLAEVIATKLKEYEQYIVALKSRERRRNAWLKAKNVVKQFDSRHFGGALLRLKRSAQGILQTGPPRRSPERGDHRASPN